MEFVLSLLTWSFIHETPQIKKQIIYIIYIDDSELHNVYSH